jgi:hypothetical protein
MTGGPAPELDPIHVSIRQISPDGGDLTPHIRTRVLNDELRDTFGRWYPGMMPGPAEAEQKQTA